MARGTTHASASLMLAPFVMGLFAYKEGPVEAIAAFMGCAAGTVLSPDLDMEQVTYSEGLVYRLGYIPGKIFYFYWYPYAAIIPHRSVWSHFPILGTGLRLAYMLFLPLLIAVFLLNELPWWTREGPYMGWFLAFVGGLVWSDTLHWIMDGLPIRFR